jgi:Transglycosylase SLT domain
MVTSYKNKPQAQTAKPVFSKTFYSLLLDACKKNNIPIEFLLNVMYIESGGFKANAHNPEGASGLIQFIPSTLKGLGYTGTPEEFEKLSAEEQVPWIEKFLANHKMPGGFKSPGQYYCSVFFPVSLQLPGVKNLNFDTIIVERNPKWYNGMKDGRIQKLSQKYKGIAKITAGFERLCYSKNMALDLNNDGKITLGDLEEKCKSVSKNDKLLQAMTELSTSTGYTAKENSINNSIHNVNYNQAPQNDNAKEIFDNMLNNIGLKAASKKERLENRYEILKRFAKDNKCL